MGQSDRQKSRPVPSLTEEVNSIAIVYFERIPEERVKMSIKYRNNYFEYRMSRDDGWNIVLLYRYSEVRELLD
jgi:hypothetical protein